MKEITEETVNNFLNGHDPMEKIISIECDYMDDMVNIIYMSDKGEKMIKKDDFKPFCWAKNSVCIRMYEGNRGTLRRKLKESGIKVKALITKSEDGKTHERIENGYKYMFYATKKMSYNSFLNFFKNAGTPIYGNKSDRSDQTKEFMVVTPVEQYMISTGKRLFKGYESYDELVRFIFDLETQGLNPKIHRIEQIGIHTNKGFEKIIAVEGNTEEELNNNEIAAIDEFLRILSKIKPDTIVGHNSENFDWDFLIVRCQMLGYNFSELSKKYFRNPIYKKKKEAILKLGGEMEYYKPTIAWGFNVLDSLHAVRRAQALDSNMKKANLKYVTKYLNLKKPNRVYVPGDKITSTWNAQEKAFAFNNENGDWYRISAENELKEGYEQTNGRYIVERYLLDDLYETDKVELRLNESNFLVAKILPTTFSRACTMGTAGIWKLIMLAWSYENDLAVPSTSENARFTGGLSRLLKVGYVVRIVKLDYNSLYPSIDLTWNVGTDLDITGIMLRLLEYILTGREKYKELKAVAGNKAEELAEYIDSHSELPKSEIKKIKVEMAKWKSEKAANDKKQLPLKILANSYFGSYGSPMVFPFGDLISAEKTTCIGRQSLRLMISHFSKIGYEPIVGDTDGFNFKMPDSFRYTEENPYISDGGGRNSIKGKAYVGLNADVAEFEDLYFNHAWNGGVNKMGLGVDELCDACIQFARKNYADLMPDGSIKLVGNTIKSRKMSGYLEKFINNAVELLLHGNGYQFLSNYYDYIDKIYNYQIPIKDIASKGNIKKSLKEYKEDCKTLTKAGSKKSRQAWYELVIKEGINVNVGDSVYYVNTGTKKGHSDVKRVTHYFTYDNEGNKVEVTKDVEKYYKEAAKSGVDVKKKRIEIAKEKFGSKAFEEDEIILNSMLVPMEIIDSEKDIYCSDVEGLEYNTEKYIDQFNKRITPLLVCFSPEIRNDIIITNPRDRKYFTEEQSELVAGYPNKETDQDTYEALMTPEKKEIAFWDKIGEVPPFVKECGIDWDELLKKYRENKKNEENTIFIEEDAKYISIINNLKNEDYDALEEEGIIPKKILDICDLGSDMRFYFKKLPSMTPSTGGYLFDDLSRQYIETNEG